MCDAVAINYRLLSLHVLAHNLLNLGRRIAERPRPSTSAPFSEDPGPGGRQDPRNPWETPPAAEAAPAGESRILPVRRRPEPGGQSREAAPDGTDNPPHDTAWWFLLRTEPKRFPLRRLCHVERHRNRRATMWRNKLGLCLRLWSSTLIHGTPPPSKQHCHRLPAHRATNGHGPPAAGGPGGLAETAITQYAGVPIERMAVLSGAAKASTGGIPGVTAASTAPSTVTERITRNLPPPRIKGPVLMSTPNSSTMGPRSPPVCMYSSHAGGAYAGGRELGPGRAWRAGGRADIRTAPTS